jgi:chromosome segregation ATPase
MEAFENIDDLFRGLRHFLTPYTIYIAIFALLCLAGAIVFFCMYRSWKSAWKTDWKYFDDLRETTHKQHNADLADLRVENKTWKESSTQAREQRQSWEDKFVEKALYMDALEEKLAGFVNLNDENENLLANLAEKEKKIKTWEERFNQLKNELQGVRDADLKAINGFLDKINEVKERYHTSCDKGVEQLDRIDDLQDQLAKSENRLACSEGKYSKVNTKLIAMDYAVDIFKTMDVEETLEEIFDGIYSRIKKD